MNELTDLLFAILALAAFASTVLLLSDVAERRPPAP